MPRLACFALLMTVGATAPAAELAILVADHAITEALPGVPHVEPHLAISPTDPRHLVAGVIVAGPERDEKPWHCAALASWDGGRSWTRTDLTVIDRCIDPWARPLLAISTDGGATFSDPRPLSATASCPRTPENGRAGESWAMGGDYGSLAVAPDGTLHALWADARDGRFRIHHSALRIERR